METLLMAKQENVDSETDSFPKAKGRENQDHAFDTHTHAFPPSHLTKAVTSSEGIFQAYLIPDAHPVTGSALPAERGNL